MYQLTASYAHPEDPEAFLEYFRTKHTPIVLEFPHLRRLSWQLCETADGTRPPHFLIATLLWGTREHALAALASPVGEKAVADLANFATAGSDIDLGPVTVERG